MALTTPIDQKLVERIASQTFKKAEAQCRALSLLTAEDVGQEFWAAAIDLHLPTDRPQPWEAILQNLAKHIMRKGRRRIADQMELVDKELAREIRTSKLTNRERSEQAENLRKQEQVARVTRTASYDELEEQGEKRGQQIEAQFPLPGRGPTKAQKAANRRPGGRSAAIKRRGLIVDQQPPYHSEQELLERIAVGLFPELAPDPEAALRWLNALENASLVEQIILAARRGECTQEMIARLIGRNQSQVSRHLQNVHGCIKQSDAAFSFPPGQASSPGAGKPARRASAKRARGTNP